MEGIVQYTDLLIGAITLIGAMLTAWVNMRMAVNSLNAEIKFLKEQVKEEKVDNNKSFGILQKKIDCIIETLTDIQVTIAKNK